MGQPLSRQRPPARSPEMTVMLDELVRGLKTIYGDALVSVVLYGSVARGTPRADSDIDILAIVEREETQSEWTARQELRDGLGQRYPESAFAPSCSKLRLLILTTAEARENRHLYLDMTRDAVILHDAGAFFSHKLDEMRKRMKELGSKRVDLPDGSWYWDLKPDLKPGEEFEL